MPELPEVERTAKMIRDAALGRKIEWVETTEDSIVYTGGISHLDFANEVTGRKIVNVERYGKVFFIELDGKGRMPVMHLGMTGMVQVRGQEPIWYQRRLKDSPDWPPRFMKFVLHLISDNAEDQVVQIAFTDARRLARIRLCQSPKEEPPISELGFDPILSMPTLETFSPLVKKRNCPIKALLLDQSFSAGVGNWIADEILYQSAVHPEQRASTLNDEQVSALWQNTVYVCKTAVDVNADSSRFPTHWLFRHRWGKGKKGEKAPFILPSGAKADIKWMTVGGRTSAVVEQVQIPPTKTGKGKESQDPQAEDASHDGNDSEPESPPVSKRSSNKRKRKAATNREITLPIDDAQSSSSEKSVQAKKAAKVTRMSSMKVERRKVAVTSTSDVVEKIENDSSSRSIQRSTRSSARK